MEHYGILTLLPPLLAILLSFATKLIVSALVAGIYIGALVISGWNPLTGITYTLQVILENFTDPGNASLILFTLFMGWEFLLSGGWEVVLRCNRKQKLPLRLDEVCALVPGYWGC